MLLLGVANATTEDYILRGAAILTALAVIARIIAIPFFKWARTLAHKIEKIEKGVSKLDTVDTQVGRLASINETIEQGLSAMQRIVASSEDRVFIAEAQLRDFVSWQERHERRHESLEKLIQELKAHMIEHHKKEGEGS